MKTPIFNSNQVVKIDNKDQFDLIYHVFRSYTKYGMSLKEWLDFRNGYPEFPIYLEYANSVYGSSIGFTDDTFNRRTNEEYEVLSFDEACCI